jgi:hypothetical protein
MNAQPQEEVASAPPPRCPLCNGLLQILLLLNVVPDGYVCTNCQLYFSDELKPLARVI